MNTIVLIDHHENPRDDIASIFLEQRGFFIDVRRPFLGDALPQVDENLHGVVVFGGSMNVTEMDEHPYLNAESVWIRDCIDANKKVLGICLGSQLMAHSLGAKIAEGPQCEFGYYPITPTPAGKGFIPDPFYVTQAHFQGFQIPEGAIHLAQGENYSNQAFQYGDNAFGFQFHPEVDNAIFTRWQDSDWAFFDAPGAQSRTQQDQIREQADAIQGDWFRNFLDQFFGHPNNASRP